MKKMRLVIVILAVICVIGLFLYAALGGDNKGGKAPEATTTVAETTTLVEMPDVLDNTDEAETAEVTSAIADATSAEAAA